MSHVSSASNSSYAYRGTLSRLDANDDGVLSRQEREAGERPGILEDNGDNSANDNSGSAMGSLMAKLMQLQSADTAPQAKSPAANMAYDMDLLSPMAAYNSTYGQYDVNSVAA
jgi:hypothetical protein